MERPCSKPQPGGVGRVLFWLVYETFEAAYRHPGDLALCVIRFFFTPRFLGDVQTSSAGRDATFTPLFFSYDPALPNQRTRLAWQTRLRESGKLNCADMR